MQGDPIFQPGDRVISFRGEYATVIRMTRDASDPGRSAKVLVLWDADIFNDETEYASSGCEYYSNVFTLVPKLDLDLFTLAVMAARATFNWCERTATTDPPSAWPEFEWSHVSCDLEGKDAMHVVTAHPTGNGGTVTWMSAPQ